MMLITVVRLCDDLDHAKEMAGANDKYRDDDEDADDDGESDDYVGALVWAVT